MVLTRNGTVVHPCIKEAMASPTKPMSRRIGELPSLRYGSIGSRSTTSGPLRLTNHYHCDTIPRSSTKKTHTMGFRDDMKYNNKSVRRVRFNLPLSDGDTRTADAGGGDVVKRTAGDGWLKTRAPISQRSDVRRRRTETIRLDSVTADRINNNRRATYYDGGVGVAVTSSPATRTRIHPTGRYIRGTLSPTANTTAPAAPTPGGQVLLRAAKDGEEILLRDLLRRAVLIGIADSDLNAIDNSGRTVLSYIASNGSVEILDQILQLPNLDVNKPDNEGNTPLHFAAQAGQVECLNCMLSRCRGIEIDARNNLGFTSLMKAALQGRNKCAKLLLFAGANPTLRDNGRGLRADQWARFCGRYVCADVIEKHARQRLLERSTSYGNWGGENEMGARILLGKVVPVPQVQQQTSHVISSLRTATGIKSKLRKVFRTSSGPGHNNDNISSARLVTQLTSAALCASTPVLPSAPTVPPVVKSLIRPLTVPRLQITLVNNNSDTCNSNLTNGLSKSQTNISEETPQVIKPARTKKKK